MKKISIFIFCIFTYYSTFAQCPTIPEWEFTTGTNNLDCWTLTNKLTGSATGGILHLTITGSDPYMHSPNNLGIVASASKKIVIKMKNNTSDNTGQLYFIRNDNGTWGETMAIGYAVVPNDTIFREYTIDLSKQIEWKNTIKQLRLDPLGGASSGTIDIDYIKVIGLQCKPLTITFKMIDDRLTTDAPFSISATSLSGNTIAFKIVSGPATLNGSTITLTGTKGVVVVSANDPGNATYCPADESLQSFHVFDPSSITTYKYNDTYNDTWVAVDELQRSLPDSTVTGGPKANKTIGLFYYVWHMETSNIGIKDISKILAGIDTWGGAPGFHHYGESLFGYYSSQDEYVIRKHIQMLSDAGVDFIFFDNTNGIMYMDAILKIAYIMLDMKADRYKVPKLSFIMHSGDMNACMEEIYDKIYSRKYLKDLMFVWEGKPTMMGEYTGTRSEVKQVFNLKHSWAWTSGSWYTSVIGEDCWPWLDNYPQTPGKNNGQNEQMIVCTAQHPTGQYAIGKSTGADRTQPPVYGTDGKYFNLQWQRALQINPPLIMITQWNEWIAQRFISGDKNWDQPGVTYMARQPIGTGSSIFIDLYTPEYSRDIEPLRIAYRDNMYLQMVGNNRKYKGVRKLRKSINPMTININSDFTQWNTVGPDFKDDRNDIFHRNNVSYGSDFVYTNNKGRNDFDVMKVSYDTGNVYFYVKTTNTITPSTDPNWMMLLINSDGDYTTGWNGYDYIVNKTVTSATSSTLMKYDATGTFKWKNPQSIQYVLKNNEMHLKIPANLLKINTKNPFLLDFKWVDNSMFSSDILDLYVDGDAAPNTRFNYRFVTDNTVKPIVQSPYDNQPATIPGTVEMEKFDEGGENVSYHDTDPTNTGNAAFRTNEGVDIKTTTDIKGAYDITSLKTGEWLEYIVSVSYDTLYYLNIRVASATDGNKIHLEMDGTDFTGLIPINTTGGAAVYKNIDTSARLKKGTHILRLFIDKSNDGISLNYIIFSDMNPECANKTEWDFLVNNECWTPSNNLTGTVSNSKYNLTIKGTNPQLISSNKLSVVAKTKTSVVIRMQNNTSDSIAQLYWTRSDSSNWSETKSVQFHIIPNDTQISEYVIDLSKNTEWKGFITCLRLDPVKDATSGTVILDYVSIGIINSIDHNNIDENGLVIYPNPASDHLNILLNKTGRYHIEMNNILGVTIYSKNVDYTFNPLSISTVGYPAGLYFISVSGQNGNVIRRVQIH